VRTVHSVHLPRRRDGFDLVVQGDGFLYNMVRTMAGTLLEVGRGKLVPAAVSEILASGDRRHAGPTLPAQGLFLVRVLYPPPFQRPDLDGLRSRACW
jgi:tRNA pseudouridine38-40 synthase